MTESKTLTSAPDYDWPHPTDFVEPKRLELIRGYVLNEQRTPARALLPITPSQTIGPFFPVQLIPAEAQDLTRLTPNGAVAAGSIIEISGKVLDEANRPVSGALVEIWQANMWGKYDHPRDVSDKPIDKNFRGFGQAIADSEGRYRFRTIQPGAYPNPRYNNWMRPPHVHFSVFGAGIMQRLITQMYFPNDGLNDIDPILNSIQDLDHRARLIGILQNQTNPASKVDTYTFDIVLRGRNETPFFAD